MEADPAKSSLAAKAVSRINKLAVVYTIAGMSFAAVLGTAYIAAARPEVLRSTSIAPFAAVFAWPAVLALNVIYPLVMETPVVRYALILCRLGVRDQSADLR